ncbi:anti-sigma factor family protein [Nonomuraea sp. SYSU D8015]|uniref:anti-sigma factor family protein n=1 Tax=Nonomuraea sp. SYSU D8015 TaxID=2593644 RepID=UPI001CB758BC|nr:zf-HC2 domain-containing protein [Nonomuraea sp. SYSU D8015]
MTCEEVRLALGAHALGALEPDEALEIDTHLATCEVCGAELLELEGVASFLGKVSERDVELVASPPRQVLDRLLNARAKRSRRGRLLLVAAASAAVLGLGGTVWAVIQESSPVQQQQTAASAPSTTPSPAQEKAQEDAPNTLKQENDQQPAPAEMRPKATPTKPPQASEAPRMALAGREFEGENRAKDYSATVMAWPSDGGTELGVGVRGVPDGTTCRLVVIGKDGRRDVTESWVISREPYQDQSAFKSTTKFAMKDIARIDVVDQTGKVLVKVPARK